MFRILRRFVGGLDTLLIFFTTDGGGHWFGSIVFGNKELGWVLGGPRREIGVGQ